MRETTVKPNEVARAAMLRCARKFSLSKTSGEVGKMADLLDRELGYSKVVEALERLHAPRPLSEWHEDFGCALWFAMPIDSPPYCGTPDCSDWPFDDLTEGYTLAWTPLPDTNEIQHRFDALVRGSATADDGVANISRCRCGHTLEEHQRTVGGKLVVAGCRICLDCGCYGFIAAQVATAAKGEPDAE